MIRGLLFIILLMLFPFNSSEAVSLTDSELTCSASGALGEVQKLGTGRAYSIDLEPNGQRLSVATASGIKSYNTETFEPVGISIETGSSGSTVIAWSPDGSRLAAYIDPSQGVRIWDATGSILTHLPANDDPIFPVFGLAWSPDSVYVATMSNSTFRVWHVESEESVYEQRYISTLPSYPLKPNSIVWSPDGTQLAVISPDRPGAVQVLDTKTWQLSQVIETSLNEIYALAWSTNDRLAVGGSGTEIELWDTLDWQQISRFQSDVTLVFSLTWSPNETFLAVGGDGNSIYVYGAVDGMLAYELPQHDWITSVEWSSNPNLLVTLGRDGSVYFWNSERRQLLSTLKHYWSLGQPVWSPDGNLLAALSTKGDQTNVLAQESVVQIWEVASKKQIAILTRDSNSSVYDSLAWSPDGTKLAAASGGSVQIWDKDANWKVTQFETGEDVIRNLVWSWDSTQLATVGDDGRSIAPRVAPIGNKVVLWDPETGTLIERLAEVKAQAIPVSTPEGWYVALSNADRVWVLEPVGKTEIFSLENAYLVDFVVTSNTQRLATLSLDTDKTLLGVWDIRSSKELLHLEGDYVTSGDLSARGNLFTAHTIFNTLELWDVQLSEQLFTEKNLIDESAWPPDENCLAVATVSDEDLESMIEIWSLSEKQPIAQVIHSTPSTGLSWSPNGSDLAIANVDGTIQVLEVVPE